MKSFLTFSFALALATSFGSVAHADSEPNIVLYTTPVIGGVTGSTTVSYFHGNTQVYPPPTQPLPIRKFDATVVIATSTSYGSVADQIQALTEQIHALIAQLPGAATSQQCTFTRDLSFGVSGDDVICLQTLLYGHGYLSVLPTGYFGPLTQSAVSKWQSSRGIVPPAGYFGPISRAAIATW